MGHVCFTPMGRMGNYMLELFTAFAYAKKHDMPFSAPTHTTSDFHCPIYCRHLTAQDYNPHLQTIQIIERQHNYIPLQFDESWRDKNILLVGFFQSEKYFKEYREEILQAVGYRWVPDILVVSLHVRRGDYVTFREKHPEVSDEFYHNAIAYFTSRGFEKFKIFSDDIPWCQNYFKEEKFNGAKFEFSIGKSIEEDLRLISCCQHHINSSSTYSLVGAWMNRNANKIVITPEKWFSDNWGDLDVSDIVPDNWIKM
jgi:hypothetical protein